MTMRCGRACPRLPENVAFPTRPAGVPAVHGIRARPRDAERFRPVRAGRLQFWGQPVNCFSVGHKPETLAATSVFVGFQPVHG